MIIGGVPIPIEIGRTIVSKCDNGTIYNLYRTSRFWKRSVLEFYPTWRNIIRYMVFLLREKHDGHCLAIFELVRESPHLSPLDKSTFLYGAIIGGHTDVVKMVLQDKSFEVRNEKELFIAIQRNMSRMVRILLADSRVKCVNADPISLILLACLVGNESIVRSLLSREDYIIPDPFFVLTELVRNENIILMEILIADQRCVLNENHLCRLSEQICGRQNYPMLETLAKHRNFDRQRIGTMLLKRYDPAFQPKTIEAIVALLWGK